MPLAIECDADRREVRVHGRRADVALSVQEFTLLDQLCSADGRVCARDELGAAIWGAGNFEYNMLHRVVHRTKRKLAPHALDSIVSIAGVGYKIETSQAAAAVAPATTAPLRFDDTQFVGRQDELTQLADVLDGVLRGASALVMVAGEPGIGKTRLSEELCVRARARGARTLAGQCYEGQASMPYAPFIEILRQYARTGTDGSVRDALGREAPAIAMLLPELRARFPDLAAQPPMHGDVERLHLFESVMEVLRRIAAESPLVLVLDDLHWADKPTMLLLQYVVHSGGTSPIMFVGSYRDIEVNQAHPLAAAVAALRREPRFHQITLRGLPAAQIAGFLPSNNGVLPEGLAAAVTAGTEGNPLFVREVVRHLMEERRLTHDGARWDWKPAAGSADLGMPEGVRAVVGRRLSRLSDDCNVLLTTASTAPDGISWDVLRSIAEQDEEQLLDLLDEALDAQVLVEGGSGRAAKFEFTHALIRRTLYDGLSHPRRMLLHRKMGEAIERIYATALDAHASELAYQFSNCAADAAGIEKAAGYAIQAGDRALNISGYEEAQAIFERALTLMEGGIHPHGVLELDLLIGLTLALRRGGEPALAMQTFERALAAARTLNDPAQFARVVLALVPREFVFGSPTKEHGDALEEALAMTPDQQAPETYVWLLALLARDRIGSGVGERIDDGIRMSVDALSRAEAIGEPGLLFEALEVRAVALWMRGDLPARTAASVRMTEVAQRIGDERMIYFARDARLCDLLDGGDIPGFSAELAELDHLSSAIHDPSLRTNYLAVAHGYATMRGRFAEADTLRDTLLGNKLLRSSGVDLEALFAYQPFSIRQDDERMPSAEVFLNASLGTANEMVARCGLAYLHTEQGQFPRAREQIDAALKSGVGHVLQGPSAVLALANLAVACVAVDALPRLPELYEALLPYASWHVANGNCAYFGPATAYLGILEGALGKHDDAERHFEDALAACIRNDTPPWTAYTAYNYAQMLLLRRGAGDTARARSLLGDALAITRQLGMPALQAKVIAAQP